ncbi:MAG: prolyl-tRNA synthetase associated domain-containing protein [Nanoarchaeota archaeon]
MEDILKKYLYKYKINYTKYEHRAVFTVEESRDLKKKIPGLHCKCIFLKDDSGRFYIVGLPAEKRLDIKKLQLHFVVRKLHFATADELWEKFKLKPGSVSIFGLVNNSERDVFFILDKEVWSAEAVGFHPNVNTATLVLKHEDLERFYKSIKNDKEVIEL